MLAKFTHWMDLQSILIFIAIFLLGVWLLQLRKRGNMPPGPTPWPIIGNAITLASNPLVGDTFSKLAKTYGGLYTLSIGPRNCIVLSSFDAIKEALVKHGDSTFGRPFTYFTKILNGGNGILFQRNLEHWKTLRRFSLTSLRDFGVGKKSIEERIQEEILAVFEEFERLKKTPFDIRNRTTKAVSNIIMNVVFGSRYEYDSKEFISIQEDFDYFFQNAGIQMIEFFIKYIDKIPILRWRAMKIINTIRRIKSFIRQRITDHRVDFDSNNIRDFVDLYLDKTSTGNAQDAALSEENMFQAISDLFLAGTETTSTSLQWAFLFMIKHPEIQEKCRKEILEVVGSSRLPCLKDQSELTYVEATLLEIQRVGNIAPLAPPHEANEDFDMWGYSIPKGTMIFVNLQSASLDPKVFPEPERFKPERWIDADGKIIRNEQFLPFGIGRRVCLGEPLAKMELFLFFTGLIQHYEFKMADPNNPPTGKRMPGITCTAEAFDIIVERL